MPPNLPNEKLKTALTEEIADLIKKSQQKGAEDVDDTIRASKDEAQKQAHIEGRMTPEQKAVNDDWQNTVRRLSAASGSKEEDEVVSESPVPTVHSDEPLIPKNDGQEEKEDESSSSSSSSSIKPKKQVAFSSSAIPMGPYQPGKHPMTGLDNQPDNIEARQDDDAESCSPWACWNWLCWSWGFKSWMGGKPKVDMSGHGPAEATS